MLTDDDPLLAAMVEEIAVREAPITMVLRPLSRLHLAGLLQLALRHPGTSTSEAHHRVAVTFLEHVRAYFAGSPAVLEVLRRGDEPSFDVTDEPMDPRDAADQRAILAAVTGDPWHLATLIRDYHTRTARPAAINLLYMHIGMLTGAILQQQAPADLLRRREDPSEDR